jgi:hypothetical protein
MIVNGMYTVTQRRGDNGRKFIPFIWRLFSEAALGLLVSRGMLNF